MMYVIVSNLPPKLVHFATATRRMGDNIMKRNEPPPPNERRICLEVNTCAGICVIAIDEKKVKRVSLKPSGDLRHSLL